MTESIPCRSDYLFMKLRHLFYLLGTSALLASCTLTPSKPGMGKVVDWDKLPGWSNDHHAKAWPALLEGCKKLPAKNPQWQPICNDALAVDILDDETARSFFEHHFVAHRFTGSGNKGKGLVTGYYEPLLYGSVKKTARYRYPLYKRPDDLLKIDLGELYPELKGKKVRGRVKGNRVVPYYDRNTINNGKNPLAGNELLWVDDPVAVFFLHIQGSGRIQMPDGSYTGVGYADQNGQPYTSIGRILIEQGEIKKEDISMFTIRDWLKNNPQKSQDMLIRNRSYIFFQLRESADTNPVGSLNVPLTPARSIAVDPKNIPMGSPVWLDTSWPDGKNTPLQRLVLAQDTGGAIKGYARADMFWGNGPRAEKLAGEMKQEARFYVLVPRVQKLSSTGAEKSSN
jgi:peptidoglycan lytic transglycosylase A